MGDVVTPGRVWLRHIKRSATGTTVLGTTFAGDADGLNGRDGFVSGQLERRLYEEGTGSVRLANAAGDDGVLHRDRFACLTDPGYLPGDEWIEVYQDNDLLAVWTPTGRQSKRRAELAIAGEDATTLLKRTREGDCGVWHHAPRDVIEYYGRAWQMVKGIDFAVPGEFYPGTGPYPASVSNADGSWSVSGGESDPAYPGAVVMSPQTGTIPDRGVVDGHTQLANLRPDSADPHMPIRLEATFVPLHMVQQDSMSIGGGGASIGVRLNGATYDKALIDAYSSTDGGFLNVSLPPRLPFTLENGTPVTLALEFRDRWVYMFVNGRTVGVLPRRRADSTGDLYIYPRAYVDYYSAQTKYLITHLALLKAPRAVVAADDGDWHLPGVPSGTGLRGDYYDATSVYASFWASSAQYLILSPMFDPAVTRVDPQINYPLANPPPWPPAGIPASGKFGVRWTGSIYLDLDNIDRAIRVTADDEARVWIAQTRTAEELIISSGGTAATSPWLKAGSVASSAPSAGSSGRFAGRPSGWYPIVVEYKQAGGTGGCVLEWSSSGAVGTWQAIPTGSLSPYGCYTEKVRNESHYDAMKAVTDAYGYQWTCEPRSLESGEFPGRITPKVRIGRDTERILDEPETVDIQADIDLDSRADAIQADAAGLADAASVAQLAAVMYDAPAAQQHPIMGMAYESLSDIGQRQFFIQRLTSLMTLRSAVWEEVSARPPGHRQLLDSWPLTGTLAEFAWQPGDGIRLNFPTVGVVDAICRQVLGISRDFSPDGMRPPAASFRPRPRSVKSLLRQVRRDALLPQRNYQQQLATITGSIGGVGGVDDFSRITLPPAVDVVTVALMTLYKSDTSTATIELNFVNSFVPVTAAGSVDLLGRFIVSPSGYNAVRLIGGTGTWTIQLIATVRI